MPRKKNRIKLECTKCKRNNYFSNKNANIKAKLDLKKYCLHCREHVAHKETK